MYRFASNYMPMLAIGLAILACFVPIYSHYWVGQQVTMCITDNYSGWLFLGVLLIFLIVQLALKKKQKKPGGYFLLFQGMFCLGYAIFLGYHAWALFRHPVEGSLAKSLGAGTYLREGLFLMLASSICFFYAAFAGFRKTIHP